MNRQRIRIVWIVFSVVTIEALFSVPFLSWELVFGSGRRGGGVLAFIAAAAVCLVVWRLANQQSKFLGSLATRLAAIPAGPWLAACFLAGCVLRLLWAWGYPAPQHSDQAAYFALARSLLENHRYGIPNGGLAYWPPGYPFFLAFWFLLFGAKAWIPLLVNVFLFGSTLIVVASLARRMGGESAARLAALLLVPWPTMVMTAGLASKEMLAMFLLCLALLTFARGRDSVSLGREISLVFLAGLLLGGASLTQPSLQLFPSVLIAYEWLDNRPWLHGVVRVVLVVVAMGAVIFPWTLRNHRVLGTWVPISTNGGDVFYRANNPLATGGYTPAGEQSLEGLDEVARGKVGFRLGAAWIRTHPVRFLALTVRKQILFLGDDAQGAFETLKRGLGIGGWRYVAWKGISNFYWWSLWTLILLTLTLHSRSLLSEDALLAATTLSFLYLFAIHSVFESGAKYHEPLMGFLAVLAGQILAPREAPPANRVS